MTPTGGDDSSVSSQASDNHSEDQESEAEYDHEQYIPEDENEESEMDFPQEEVRGENEESETDSLQEEMQVEQNTIRRSTRERRPPDRYKDYEVFTAGFGVKI